MLSLCIPVTRNSKCFSLVVRLKIFKTCIYNLQKFIKTGAYLFLSAIIFEKKLPIWQKMYKKKTVLTVSHTRLWLQTCRSYLNNLTFTTPIFSSIKLFFLLCYYPQKKPPPPPSESNAIPPIIAAP